MNVKKGCSNLNTKVDEVLVYFFILKVVFSDCCWMYFLHHKVFEFVFASDLFLLNVYFFFPTRLIGKYLSYLLTCFGEVNVIFYSYIFSQQKVDSSLSGLHINMVKIWPKAPPWVWIGLLLGTKFCDFERALRVVEVMINGNMPDSSTHKPWSNYSTMAKLEPICGYNPMDEQ